MNNVVLTLGQLLSYSGALVAIGFGLGHIVTHLIYEEEQRRIALRQRIDNLKDR